MINDIIQNISPVTALPGLLAPERPAAVNTLVEEELPLLSTELETLVGQINTFVTETNQTATDVENNKNSAAQSAILANGLANFKGAWSGLVSYSKGESAESTSGSKIYYTSRVDSNLNNIVTDTNYWLYNPINDKLDKSTTGLTPKTTPVDADVVLIGDSAASNITKKTTWANIKATIISSFGAMIRTLTEKTTPVNSDGFIIADSASSNKSKLLTFENLKNTIFGSPALTGTPTAPTATAQTNNTQIATTAYVDGKFIRGTAVASTSGTSIDFTGLPSWAKRITIIFSGVSLSGASQFLFQLGSTTFQTTGYNGGGARYGASTLAGARYTNGFSPTNTTATMSYGGSISFHNISSNIWVANGNFGANGTDEYGCFCGGNVTLSGVLDRVRITTVNGTDTFDAGSINIMYEG